MILYLMNEKRNMIKGKSKEMAYVSTSSKRVLARRDASSVYLYV